MDSFKRYCPIKLSIGQIKHRKFESQALGDNVEETKDSLPSMRYLSSQISRAVRDL